MKKAIYVIDPGLMEAGGHHAALIEALISSGNLVAKLTVVSHQNLNRDLTLSLGRAGIELWRHFSSNFYQFYDDGLDLKLSGIQGYIRGLAWQYIQVLNKIDSEPASKSEVVCLYPSLNWEHASALNIAMLYCANHNKNITHKICCMFKPDKECTISNFHYQMAFTPLAQRKGVMLFASDWETHAYYKSLKVPISGIHPCYLLPWQQIAVSKSVINEMPKVLLYMGDAKQNKGFLLVPFMVKQLLNDYHFKVQLVVHYTLAWETPELLQTADELEQLAQEYSQLQVISKFWSTEEVINCMTECDKIVCSYEPGEYMHKSSGLIWLAAFFQLPVLLRGKSWLTRECERLGVPYAIGSSFISTPLSNSKDINTSYSKTLFTDLVEWLIK